MSTRKPPLTLNAAVAAELRAEAAAQRLTNQAVADLSGLHRNSVQHYLAGERAINVDNLEALALAVGSTPRLIIERALARMAQSTPPTTKRPSSAAESRQSGVRSSRR